MKTGVALIMAAALAAALVGYAKSLAATGYVTAGTGSDVTINAGKAIGIQPGDPIRVYADNGKRFFFLET